jgi:hypothetical protein
MCIIQNQRRATTSAKRRVRLRPQAKVDFYCLEMKVQLVHVRKYLMGGFIDGCDPKLEWAKEKVKVRTDGVNILTSVAKRYLRQYLCRADH